MASKIYTPSGASQLSTIMVTDKVSIATTGSAIAVAVGNAAVTANVTACQIIPANTVEKSFYVGQGNYIAYINANGTAAIFSVTELGANHP